MVIKKISQLALVASCLLISTFSLAANFTAKVDCICSNGSTRYFFKITGDQVRNFRNSWRAIDKNMLPCRKGRPTFVFQAVGICTDDSFCRDLSSRTSDGPWVGVNGPVNIHVDGYGGSDHQQTRSGHNYDFCNK